MGLVVLDTWGRCHTQSPIEFPFPFTEADTSLRSNELGSGRNGRMVGPSLDCAYHRSRLDVRWFVISS